MILESCNHFNPPQPGDIVCHARGEHASMILKYPASPEHDNVILSSMARAWHLEKQESFLIHIPMTPGLWFFAQRLDPA